MAAEFFIYLITNLTNDKAYVGKSVDPSGRWHDHKKVALGGREKYPNDFFAVHAALAKYGIDNFSFEIIDQFDSEAEAYAAETMMILLACSNLKKYGYNCNLGGEGGIVPNEETRQKLIAAQNKPEKKKISSDLMRARHQADPGFLGRINVGNQYTKGRVPTQEERDNLSKIFTGRIVSEGTRQKMSEGQSGEKHSQARLTKENVLELREAFSKLTSGKKKFCEVMAEKYGVGYKTIENVVYKISWVSI